MFIFCAVQDDLDFEFDLVSEPSDQERADLAKCGTDNIVTAYNAGLISQRTALREMKQQSSRTGTWTNITDEEIMNASDEIEPRVRWEDSLAWAERKTALEVRICPMQAAAGRWAINHPRHLESRQRRQRRRTTASLFTIPPAMTWMRTGTITIHRTVALPRRELAVAMYL